MRDKIPIILIFAILALGLGGLAVSLNTKIVNMQQQLDIERYNRLTVEEEKAQATVKLKNLESQLETANQKIANIQTILTKEEASTLNLQAQLDEAQKAKERLERQLQSELESTPTPQDNSGS